ncbi:hypothetical protein HMN09_00503500 [Mycena chlorophos]|uniref:MBOAT-domain-containing protein n=1 Tax=Mycena chlorophos TaxID=658473 RepID=A0A8H6T9R1_MYCCL|nr:hypothetical protein HMN09_00503500 [Mycena chlorophos]
MAPIPLIRLVALGVVTAFAVIVLGLCASVTSDSEKYFNGYFEFAALGIATAILTMVTLPAMIALEMIQGGRAFSSMIAVELSWLFILWVLWLATAADATNAASIVFIADCGDYLSTITQSACRQVSGIQAFAYLNWLILMAYTIFVLVLTLIATSRKHTGVWTTSVGEAPFFQPGNNSEIPPTSQAAGTAPGSYSLNPVQANGYNTEPYQPTTIHNTGASEGGTGPSNLPRNHDLHAPNQQPTFLSQSLHLLLSAIAMVDPFQALAEVVGASADQVKLIFSLLITYPLGSLFVRVPSSQPALRHLFSIVASTIILIPLLHLHTAFLQLLASILATFFITKYVHGKKMPWVVFVVAMGHLTVNHIIRLRNNFSYETLEVTSPQMVLVMKLTTFGWNVYDGRRTEEARFLAFLLDIDGDKWQMTKRVVKFPSLLEFLGYSFYFPGMLVGPYLDFAGYMDLVNETTFKNLKLKGKSGRNLPDGRKRVAYRKMAIGLMNLGLFVVLGPTWSFQLTKTQWFINQPLYIKIAVHQACGTTERFKYYALWILTEGASIVTGNGFSGIGANGKTEWEGARNVTPLGVELPDNWKTSLDNWNTKTSIWLRETVYKRITPKGKKPGFSSSMLTFFTSAFWHGTAGGYYLSFLTGGFITTIGRLARANFRPLVLPPAGKPPTLIKRLYDVVGTFITILLLNYTVAPFMLLTTASSLETWRYLYFYGHVIIVAAMVFFYAGGAKVCRALQKKMGVAKPPSSRSTKPAAETPAEEKLVTMPPPLDKVVPPPS